MIQTDFFGEPVRYPDRPGFKVRDTSRKAAEAMTPKAKPLRDRVLAAIRAKPGTPEDIAARLREPVMNIRPRLSELSAKGFVMDSGERGPAMGGRQAIVWRAA